MNIDESILDTPESERENYFRNRLNWKHRIIKIIVLLLVSVVFAGPSFCYDNFVPLQNAMVEHIKLSEIQYNSLTSFYSIPNIFFVVFSGITVDTFGYQLCTSLFCLICLIGQAIFCLAVYNKNYLLLITGRLIFGFGSESLQISVNKYVVNWFFGSWLTISFSLIMCVSRFSSFLNVFFSLKMYKLLRNILPKYDPLIILALIFTISVIIAFVSFSFSIFLWLIDSSWHHRIVEERVGHIRRDIFSAFNHLSDFSATFWLMSFFILLYVIPFSSYTSISPLYYQLKFGYYAIDSNTIISVNSLIGVFLSPIFGFLVGFMGIEIFWISLASYICLIAHGTFVFSFVSPYFLLIMRSMASCMIFCGFWPVIKYITPSSSMAFGYGILLSSQNLGLSVSPILIASILSSYGYFYLEIFLLMCLSAALITCFAIYLVDKNITDGVLALTTQEKCRLALMRDLSSDVISS